MERLDMRQGSGASPGAAPGAPLMGAIPQGAIPQGATSLGATSLGATSLGATSLGAVEPQRPALVARMVAKVAANPCTSLAIIAVLTILVVGLYVYYQGFMFLGPYAPRVTKRGARGAEKGAEKDSAADKDSAKGDPETERLIESINSA